MYPHTEPPSATKDAFVFPASCFCVARSFCLCKGLESQHWATGEEVSKTPKKEQRYLSKPGRLVIKNGMNHCSIMMYVGGRFLKLGSDNGVAAARWKKNGG